MTPVWAAVLIDFGLLFGMLASVALLVLGVGWSVVGWVERRREHREGARQRRLLVQLTALEMACGGEFPQVGATAQYVRGLVAAGATSCRPLDGVPELAPGCGPSAGLGSTQGQAVDVVAFRARLRRLPWDSIQGRYGPAPGSGAGAGNDREGGKDGDIPA